MIILVTGATGFVGSAVLSKLSSHPVFSPRAVFRSSQKSFTSSELDAVQVASLNFGTDWTPALQGVDVVVHLAARAHVIKEDASDPLKVFRETNTAGTLNLARQAVAAGVKRFVFISSIGVNGNQNDSPFTEQSPKDPVEPYAVSKMEAEQELQLIAEEKGMEVVIIRPPLVYGPNAPGNFGRLFRTVAKGIPLPLGAIHNKRSLVALENLVDLIVTCIHHPAAANQTFLAGDGEDLSTTELLQQMAKAMGRPSRLFPVPAKILGFAATLVGKRAMAQRLCGSLQVDISKASEVLGWTPPISVDEGLRRAAEGFLREKIV